MSLKDQITEDMKTAMRAKDSERLGTIRLLLAAMKQKEVDERVTLDDAMIVSIVDKLVKQRKDSVAAFTQGGRTDLADKEAAEIKIIESYMPTAAGEEEVVAAVRSTITEMGTPTMKDMGTVMKNAMAKFAASGTRVDGKLVSEIVKRELSK